MLSAKGLIKEYCQNFNITDTEAIIAEDVIIMISKIISDDYVKTILNKFLVDIIEDVVLTSGIKENGTYTNDDLRMSIGRIFIDNYNFN